MEKRLKILSFGEILWDVYPDGEEIGGAPFNFISWTAKLGADSAFLTAVGEDERGEKTLNAIARRGVRTDFVETLSHPTGICDVVTDERGVPSYRLRPDAAYDHIRIDAQRVADERFDVFYFGTLAQRSAHNRAELIDLLDRTSFPEIFCDVNLRPDCYDGESVKRCLSRATVLKFSEEELPALRRAAGAGEGDFYTFLAANYPNIKVIARTLGGEGSEVFDTRSRTALRFRPERGVRVVSTVGAGDSYGAAFLFCYASGLPLSECGKRATEISSYVVSIKGAI